MHEFGHYCDDRFNLLDKYLQMEFKSDIDLNEYASTSKMEELAELLSLYFVNPYLLKYINIERFNWVKNFFKSPSPNSSKRFISLFNNWPKDIKKECWNKYKIRVTSKNEIIKRN